MTKRKRQLERGNKGREKRGTKNNPCPEYGEQRRTRYGIVSRIHMSDMTTHQLHAYYLIFDLLRSDSRETEKVDQFS